MHQNISLGIIIGISLVVITSWIFLIAPDLKNSTEYFETMLEAEGQSIQSNLRGIPAEPILHQSLVRQDVVDNDGNILKIVTSMYTRDIITKENFLEFENVDLVDRTTRKFLEKEDAYFLYPYNTQKQGYNFWTYVNGVPFETKFVKTDYLKNLEVYVFESRQIFDISGTVPQFPTEQIEEELIATFFVEPITGKFVAYESVWKDWVIKDGEKILIMDAFEKTTEYSRTTETKTALDQIQLFYLYDTIIPILLVAISAGSVLVVFVNQNLRTRTEELKEIKKKKVEEVLYEVIPNCVVTFDKNNRLEDCNKKFVDALGFSKDELIGKNPDDLLVEEDLKRASEILQCIVKGEQIMEYELHLKKKDGSTFHSIWNAMPIYDDNNEYIGFLSTGIDLTEIDKLRDELVKKEKFAVLGQLAANIAHDIRNPLTSLKNSMYFIQKSPNPQTVQREQPRVNRSIDRIAHQVDDVLEYVGFSPLQFAKKSIREILISSYNLMPIRNNININFPDNDIKIECDEKKLERVFLNILLNAVQAIGSDKGSIDVRIHDKDERVEIEFENSGPSIDEENLDKIFEPLFTTKMQGTGLGLAGCKNIVNLHGGIISVTNNPTIFRIELPKRQ